jgi:hypothetical protein
MIPHPAKDGNHSPPPDPAPADPPPVTIGLILTLPEVSALLGALVRLGGPRRPAAGTAADLMPTPALAHAETIDRVRRRLAVALGGGL